MNSNPLHCCVHRNVCSWRGRGKISAIYFICTRCSAECQRLSISLEYTGVSRTNSHILVKSNPDTSGMLFFIMLCLIVHMPLLMASHLLVLRWQHTDTSENIWGIYTLSVQIISSSLVPFLWSHIHSDFPALQYRRPWALLVWRATSWCLLLG